MSKQFHNVTFRDICATIRVSIFGTIFASILLAFLKFSANVHSMARLINQLFCFWL